MRARRHQQGFSLIEILIAVVILSVGMLSIATMQTAALKGNARSNDLTARTTACSNVVERLLALPFTDPDLANGSHNPQSDTIDNDGDGQTDEADEDGESNYTVSWLVTDDPNDPRKKDLQVTLSGGRLGRNTTLIMNTVLIR